MRRVTAFTLLALLAAGCSMVRPREHVRKPLLMHPYLPMPQSAMEIKNLNPNRDGEPWIAGGLVLPTDEALRGVPVVSFPGVARGLPGAAPVAVDNSKKKYFRGIFSQRHGSCAQASGISYVYGYEVNLMRGVDAKDAVHRYPTHWTYNFVNHGYDRGSWMMWGWEVGKILGVPNVKAYGTETGFDLRYWPSEYDVYENAMDSRVERYFIMQAGTKQALDSVKRYLWNHGVEGKEGGIVSVAAGWSAGYAEARIPEGQHGAGMKLISSFGKQVNHAVTFVGYDDRICHDYNKDGVCSNDKDQNGDGRVDLKDWEVGAFIMANSWGTGWGNAGFIYVPYRLAALDPGKGGIYRQSVYGVTPLADEEKRLALRMTMQHDRRNALSLMSMYRDNDAALYQTYYGLQRSGGAYPLNGKDGGAVTFGLDLRKLIPKDKMADSLDISSIVDSTGVGVGNILQVEVVDYVNDTVTEADDNNVAIKRGRNSVLVQWEADPEPDPDPDPDPEPEFCKIGPVALAGPNLVVSEHCILVLDATDSYDVDEGKIVSYQWRQRSGRRRVKIEDADTATPKLIIPMVEKQERYVFELKVTDDDGFVDTDFVVVTAIDRVK